MISDILGFSMEAHGDPMAGLSRPGSQGRADFAAFQKWCVCVLRKSGDARRLSPERVCISSNVAVVFREEQKQRGAKARTAGLSIDSTPSRRRSRRQTSSRRRMQARGARSQPAADSTALRSQWSCEAVGRSVLLYRKAVAGALRQARVSSGNRGWTP